MFDRMPKIVGVTLTWPRPCPLSGKLSMRLLGRGYRGGSPTAVQAWQPCPLWELSP